MKVSIIVPTYNEAGNVQKLLDIICLNANRDFEIIAVDDHSTDGTWEVLTESSNRYPLRAFKKAGKKGKAFSLIEGFSKASGDAFVFIDSDLQYPADQIFKMADLLEGGADVVAANRKIYSDSHFRKLQSDAFKNIFGKFLLGVDHDAQAGLKAFKKRVWETVKFKPKSGWTFDMEFLLRVKKAGFRIADWDIVFEKRHWGKSKINGLVSVFQLAWSALRLRFSLLGPMPIPPVEDTMRGAGVGWKGRKYITHTTLPHDMQALQNLYPWQKMVLLALGVFFWPL